MTNMLLVCIGIFALKFDIVSAGMYPSEFPYMNQTSHQIGSLGYRNDLQNVPYYMYYVGIPVPQYMYYVGAPYTIVFHSSG